ncbi:hypothetical protein C8Q75DRAFT_790644 [Abortiporus biennis]|nr:hypothetical protein C8Q75DRAFT_790644 [Abortiporus biennis]
MAPKTRLCAGCGSKFTPRGLLSHQYQGGKAECRALHPSRSQPAIPPLVDVSDSEDDEDMGNNNMDVDMDEATREVLAQQSPNCHGYSAYATRLDDDNPNPYHPFTSQLDWEVAYWAKTEGPGSNATTHLLKISGFQERLGLSYKNSRELNQIIDKKLPSPPPFQRKELVIAGEHMELHYRDIMECIKIIYVPVIISSNKTQLTTFRNKTAYPVYLTIGNLPKEIRSKPSRCGQILLAYLPTSRLEYVKNKAARRRAVINLYHACMRKIMSLIRKPGQDGVSMASGDGAIHRVHPIYASHVGDYPEQVQCTCVKTGECPVCTVPRDELEKYDVHYPVRDLKVCVKPVLHPFCKDLPYTNPYLSITPDILHQMLQGVLKHLVEWIKSSFSEDELDSRITPLSHITGREHSDIARILLSILIDLPLPQQIHQPRRLLYAVSAILNFLYLAQYPVQTTETLEQMEKVLATFHENKDIFIDLGVCENFNFPKLHYVSHHYLHFIQYLGSADNFNMEFTERLHIDLAKDAYAATNSKNEFLQMSKWLERQEKMYCHFKFLQWQHHITSSSSTPSAISTSTQIIMTKHPSVKAATVESLVTNYGAILFQDCLREYLVKSLYPTATSTEVRNRCNHIQLPSTFVAVYHKAKFWLGDNHQYQLLSNEYEIVQNQARFDTVIIKQGLEAEYLGVKDYRIAQIRVIFQLPLKFLRQVFPQGHKLPKFLAYVEWFTSFKRNPEFHGYYQVKRQLCGNNRVASIIPLIDIRRSVHLSPKWGHQVLRHWNSYSVLDQCSTFFVNSHSDRHANHTIV